MRSARFGVTAAAALFAACGLNLAGTQRADDAPGNSDASSSGRPDAGVLHDGTVPHDDGPSPPNPDASPSDSGVPLDAADAGAPCLSCNGTCVADCHACPGTSLQCGTTCVSTCAACKVNGQDLPTECYSCDSAGVNPAGECARLSFLSPFCPMLPNRYSCPCDGGVQSCPSADSICTSIFNYNVCRTCGEVNSVGVSCKSGLTCDLTGACR
jgi:hypothetical protein